MHGTFPHPYVEVRSETKPPFIAVAMYASTQTTTATLRSIREDEQSGSMIRQHQSSAAMLHDGVFSDQPPVKSDWVSVIVSRTPLAVGLDKLDSS